MTGQSTPATGGVTDDPIRIGTLLYTLVEPHRGHQVAYNRWYERDHFYAGCQIGAFNFAGARFVATAPLKGLRYPDGADGPWWPIRPVGSYLGLYYVLDGHHDEWNRWAVDQVNALHAAGRMFEERDHIHTGLYHFEWEHRRDEDGVPAELTLDHRFPGMVSVFVEPADGVTAEQVGDLVPRRLPALGAPGLAGGHRAGLQPAAPVGRRPRRRPPGDDRRPSGCCSCGSSTRSPAALGRRLRRPGRGRGRRRARPGGLGLAVHRHRARHRHLHRPAVVGAVPMSGLHRRAGRAHRRPGLGRRPHLVGADRAPGRGHARRRAGPRGHRPGADLRRLPRRLPAGRRRPVRRPRGRPPEPA